MKSSGLSPIDSTAVKGMAVSSAATAEENSGCAVMEVTYAAISLTTFVSYQKLALDLCTVVALLGSRQRHTDGIKLLYSVGMAPCTRLSRSWASSLGIGKSSRAKATLDKAAVLRMDFECMLTGIMYAKIKNKSGRSNQRQMHKQRSTEDLEKAEIWMSKKRGWNAEEKKREKG